MCGVSAILNYRHLNPVSPHHLQRMVDVQRHRGRDGEGVVITDWVGMGHNRLSIVDLSDNNAQPFQGWGKSLTFKGEIFNFIELREELMARGYEFRTSGDTEVLLAAFDFWGDECFSRFNGFFAGLIYEPTSQTVTIFRDRFGIKPLFYWDDGNKIVLASEAKAILALPFVITNPNLSTMLGDLTFSFWSSREHSYFEGIECFPPSTVMHVTPSGTRTHQYWVVPDVDQGYTTETVLVALMELLPDAVECWAHADVRVGSILSGGLDSSLITALHSTHSPDGQVTDCFTLDYGTATEDLRHSTLLCDLHVNLHLNHVTLKPENLTLESVDQATWHMEEFLQDKAYLSILANYQMAQRKGCRAVINGQGADELWLGYYHSAPFLRHGLQHLTLSSITEYFSGRLPLPLLRASAHRDSIRQHLALTFQDQYQNPEDFLNDAVRFGLHHHLRNLLGQEDRLAMASTVEVRVPYLDHRLVELSLKVPARLKVADGTEKYLLRRAATNILPQTIIDRQKQAFPDQPHEYGSHLTSMVTPAASNRSELWRALFRPMDEQQWHSLSPYWQWKCLALLRFEAVFL